MWKSVFAGSKEFFLSEPDISKRIELALKRTPYESLPYVRRVEDPFTARIVDFTERASRLIAKNDALPDHQPLYGVISELRTFVSFRDRPRFEHRLESAMNKYDSFEKSAIKILQICWAAHSRARVEYRIERIGKAIDDLTRKRDELNLMREILTPAHVLLNSHFVHEVVRSSRKEDREFSKATAAFYEPLYELRERFFFDADPLFVRAYLDQLEQLTAHEFYGEIMGGEQTPERIAARKQSEALAVELEVFTLFK